MRRLLFMCLPVAALAAWSCVSGDVGDGGSGATSSDGAVTSGGPGSGGATTGSVGNGGSADTVGAGGSQTTSGSNASSAASTAASTSASSATSSSSTGGGSLDVCTRWKADRADMSEGMWTGSVSACDAGDVKAPGVDNALKIVNLYRFLAGLPAVTHDSNKNAGAQACALMMSANGQLNHFPPMSWKCYSSAGAGAAGKSNIASTPGVTAVDLYMADPGNPTTIGHRRWILSNSLGPIGLGSTSNYSCMSVIGGSGNGGKKFLGWPPAGKVPIQAFNASFQSLDSTGWTVQSDSINLGGAKVTVTDNGTNKPVTVVQLMGGYGSTYALRFNPSGWSTAAGHTYHVSVTGASQAIEYDVEVVDCK